MFKGSHNVKVDGKGRIAIPTRLREQLMETCQGDLVVTADYMEPCLLFYPRQSWETLESEIMAKRNSSKEWRWVERHLIGHATDMRLDQNGRVLLSPALREYAGLEKKAILVGATNKVELWSESVWQAGLESWRQRPVDEASVNEHTETLIESLPI